MATDLIYLVIAAALLRVSNPSFESVGLTVYALGVAAVALGLMPVSYHRNALSVAPDGPSRKVSAPPARRDGWRQPAGHATQLR